MGMFVVMQEAQLGNISHPLLSFSHCTDICGFSFQPCGYHARNVVLALLQALDNMIQIQRYTWDPLVKTYQST